MITLGEAMVRDGRDWLYWYSGVKRLRALENRGKYAQRHLEECEYIIDNWDNEITQELIDKYHLYK